MKKEADKKKNSKSPGKDNNASKRKRGVECSFHIHLGLVHTGTQSFRSQFMEKRNKLLTRERDDCVAILLCAQTGPQSFR